MAAITPFLWFNTEAEEAATFYTSVFRNSKINSITRYGDSGPGPKGAVMVIDFEIEGQRVTGLNGGPKFPFTEAFSFVVHCKNQAEVDEYWSRLTSGGGKESMCGWLKDKYGLSWQILPEPLLKMMTDSDPKKVNRVMAAVMTMKKIDLAAAQQAYEQQ